MIVGRRHQPSRIITPVSAEDWKLARILKPKFIDWFKPKYKCSLIVVSPFKPEVMKKLASWNAGADMINERLSVFKKDGAIL